MNSTNKTLNVAYVDNGPKATKPKRHSVVHFIERPDGVRESRVTHWPTEAEARTQVKAAA